MNFSLLFPIHKAIHKDWLSKSLASILNQSKRPTEIIIIQDGEITSSLTEEINNFKKKINCKIVKIPKNKGLTNALNEGIKEAKYDWLARFDADDINLPDRFQKQIDFLKKNPEVDLVGGYCLEFDKLDTENYKMKNLPLTSNGIRSLLKKRNSINHTTVFYRKSAVLKAGCYQGNFSGMEDYYLWVRMLLNGFCLRNIPEKLVLQRAGEKMLTRRGGWNYFLTEVKLQSFFLQKKFINIREFIENIVIRFLLRLSPNMFRNKLYNAIRIDTQLTK